jgi:hypothetical protein
MKIIQPKFYGITIIFLLILNFKQIEGLIN